MMPGPPAPYLAVADTKYVEGIDGLNDLAPALAFLPIQDAFNTRWSSDAHFVCYHPVNSPQPFPRLNKPVLPKMRMLNADIMTNVFAFDYDNPNHAAWDPGLMQQFWNVWHEAVSRCPMLDQFSLLYTTKAGARLVYLLDSPVPVDIAEGKHRWMVKTFCDAGLPVDHLSDWTRLFRLPFVVRDNVPTWNTGMHYIPRFYRPDGQLNTIKSLELPMLEPAARGSQYGQIREFAESKPLIEDALALLEERSLSGGKPKMSPFLRAARTRLRGRECYGCLFEHLPLAESGARDTTLHRYVGQATAMLMPIAGTTPAHIYALFLSPVQQLEPDQATPDWTDTLWDHVGRIWVREEAKIQEVQQQQLEQNQNALELIDRVVAGMREWCTHPALFSEDMMICRDFAMKHMVASCGGKYFVLRSDGWYHDHQLQPPEVAPMLRALGMDSLVQIRTITDQGFRSVGLQTILDNHATVVSSIEGVPQYKGGFIRRVDDSTAVMVTPTYRRNEMLDPTFDDDVDMWLQMLFGERYLEGCEWVANALAFEEGPICALSIQGDAGAGKKMLAVGLSECLVKPMLAGAEDIVGENQYGLLQSPFLVVDEGWPAGTRNGKHPADQFRSLVGGQAFYCKRKFMAPVLVSNPVRILFTANNVNVIQMLTANRDLSPEDREALRIRLKHINVKNKAAVWLRQQGGLRFTGKSGRRWIAGDGGEPSDFRVARHFLWLYHQRDTQSPRFGGEAKRFLVEGDATPELMFEMRTQSGSTPIVIEAIIKLLNINQQREGVVVQDNSLFILASEILEFHRNNASSREKLSSNTVSQVMKNITLRIHEGITLRERPTLTRRRWYEVDPHLILQYARKDGWSCKKLEQLVQDRQTAGVQNLPVTTVNEDK